MAKALQDCCLAIVGRSATLMADLLHPNYPTAASFTPFVVTYPDEGNIDSEQIPATKGMHYIITEVHLASSELALAIEKAIPLIETFCKSMLVEPTLGGTCDTIVGPITYKFGRLVWGGKQEEHIGVRFRTQVKIRQDS